MERRQERQNGNFATPQTQTLGRLTCALPLQIETELQAAADLATSGRKHPTTVACARRRIDHDRELDMQDLVATLGLEGVDDMELDMEDLVASLGLEGINKLMSG